MSTESSLKDLPLAFVVCTPHASDKSNGISVVIEMAAISLQSKANTFIIPGHSLTPNSLSDHTEHIHGVPMQWNTPLGCIAIICDTISLERLKEVRENAFRVIHFSLAPKGLFQSAGSTHVMTAVLDGEMSAVYSPQVSTKIPSFYFQSEFSTIQHFIDSGLLDKALAKKRKKAARSKLCVSVYAGKGRIQPIHHDILLSRIDAKRLKLITRRKPKSKKNLYELLISSDLLISFDPITSLNHESILLGTPVLVIPPWDEPDFTKSFPVSLNGIAWSDIDQALHYVNHGFNHEKVLNDYKKALVNNADTVKSFLEFCLKKNFKETDHATENEYWKKRQPFFKALSLPSQFANEWFPADKIIPMPNQYNLTSRTKRRIRQLTFMARDKLFAANQAFLKIKNIIKL